MKTNFTRNLQMGLGLTLILLIGSSVTSYISIEKLLQSSNLVNHTNTVILSVEKVSSIVKDAETGQRGYLLTNDPEYLQSYSGANEQLGTAINELQLLIKDNPEQIVRSEQLRKVIFSRMASLQLLIDLKQANKTIDLSQLKQSKTYMDQARSIVAKMEAEEKLLLLSRTATMNKFASLSSFIIILAAFLALAISIYSYTKVSRDYLQKIRLQDILEEKDKETAKRISVIHINADKISQGDYHNRIVDNEKDDLGRLTIALNKMAGSLQFAFERLSDNEWLQTGVALLNDKVVGEQTLTGLTHQILEFAAEYTKSQVGALYILERNILYFQSGFALMENKQLKEIKIGEGLPGQCALSKKEIVLTATNETNFISYATGETKPANIAVIPIFHDNEVKGVIELGSINAYSELQLTFLKNISTGVGVAIHSAQNRKRLVELSEETKVLADELQKQHSELQNLNTELEANSQKLQTSEEELRVQQEELQLANRALEERSRLLEERNQMILERNQEIQKKSADLEVTTKYKTEFMANMSHELRTPLNSILLLSRYLSDNNEKNLTADQIESAEVILNAGNGLLNLIDEILDLSKIEAGKMELEYSDVTVEEILVDLRSLFSPVAREKGLALKFDIDKGTPEKLETDKTKLLQILKNLISNGLKFTSVGGLSLTISTNKDQPDFFEFSVKDSGIGIAEDKQHLVFEAFQQADGSTKRKYGGTGLGLSISKELAKLLEGEIILNSTPGKGSEFILRIPSSKQELKNTDHEPIHESITPKNNLPEVVKKRFITSLIPQDIPDDRDNIIEGDKVILIVEDDTAFANILLKFSRKNGYKVIIAVRGDAGIELARTYHPLAILLDIELPIKDGWEVMEELKSFRETRHIPVHIMSSLEVKKESLLKGAVDFISKPVVLEQIKLMFKKLEEALIKSPKKVLIIEENQQHAKALAYFLETYKVSSKVCSELSETITELNKSEVDCVILDLGINDAKAYETMEKIKQSPGLENLPIIIFTGKNLSASEESKIRQYADSIVVKTAHSYQRILDEVALFLHIIENTSGASNEISIAGKLGSLSEILKDKTVLIADDDVRNIFSMTKSLEKYRMKVISATDGVEALEKLEQHPEISIVLMDIMMPEMDGYESIARIRSQPRLKNLPIIAVTAKTMVGDRQKCIEAGASDYISKPVDFDQLISLLRVWLYDKFVQ